MELEESTCESYARNLRLHVIPRIGSVQLQALDPAHLNRLYADLLAGGRLDGREGGLSARTVRYIATILHKALKDAVAWNRIVRNPTDAAKPPRARDARPPAMKTWTATQLRTFLGRMAGDRYEAPFTFLATTGVRRGEALGLRWTDVDLERGTAAIRTTITTVRHRIKTDGATKTDRARLVELDAGTVAVLRAWKATQAQERLLMGAGYQDHGLVFTLPDGRPYHPERFSREFDRRIERFGLERIRLHDLRHTWATLALHAGIHPKVVAERLGHANTLNVYSHVTAGMQADAAEKVAGLIFRGTQ